MQNREISGFRIWGGEEVGLKVADILQYKEMLEEYDFVVPGGDVLAAELFDIFIKKRGFTHETPYHRVMQSTFHPIHLFEVNQQIISKMTTGRCYTLRSSARSERGGSGIYTSSYFIPKGDITDDMRRLWRAERIIYASEFTGQAREWRQKQSKPIGMAVLIQELQADIFGPFDLGDNEIYGHYAYPALSGSAYTSYSGEPLIRFVFGLGTRAVQDDARVFREVGLIQPNYFARLRATFEKVDLIDMRSGKLVERTMNFHLTRNQATYEPLLNLWHSLDRMKAKYGGFYLEWVLQRPNARIQIVQCTSHEDKLLEALPQQNTEGYKQLAQGSDMVNHGIIRGSIILCLTQPSGINTLLSLNSEYSGYLLIVPQRFFSRVLVEFMHTDGASSLNYSHFSNAGAILEKQNRISLEDKEIRFAGGVPIIDHSIGVGGLHFQQLCSRTDILFLGAIFDDSVLKQEKQVFDEYPGLLVFNVPFIVFNDILDNQGAVYIEEHSREFVYTMDILRVYDRMLRDVANQLNAQNDSLSKYWYNVEYALPLIWQKDPNGFDSFAIDPDFIKEVSVDEIRKSIEIVLEHGEDYFYYDEWEELSDYLRALLDHLN